MIKRIRNTRIIFLYILFLMSCTLSVSTLQVSAATKKGSIEIHYKGRTDSQGEGDLSGATFTLFQILSADYGELVWNEEFASAGISLKDTSAGAREKQAKKLFDYAKKNNITGTTQDTNTAGYTSFLNLDEGIYLLAQIGTVDSGTEQFESAPFLIEVPSEISGRFEYNVETEPKAEWVSKKEPPVVPNQPGDTPEKTPGKKEQVSSNPIRDMIDKVKTGDETTFITWICIACAGLGIMIVIYRKRNKE